MGNRAIASALAYLERQAAERFQAELAKQWGIALRLWGEEYDFWSNFHRKSLILGNAKQSDEVFTETVCERISRVLPLRVRKEKIDLRSAIEVIKEGK